MALKNILTSPQHNTYSQRLHSASDSPTKPTNDFTDLLIPTPSKERPHNAGDTNQPFSSRNNNTHSTKWLHRGANTPLKHPTDTSQPQSLSRDHLASSCETVGSIEHPKNGAHVAMKFEASTTHNIKHITEALSPDAEAKQLSSPNALMHTPQQIPIKELVGKNVSTHDTSIVSASTRTPSSKESILAQGNHVKDVPSDLISQEMSDLKQYAIARGHWFTIQVQQPEEYTQPITLPLSLLRHEVIHTAATPTPGLPHHKLDATKSTSCSDDTHDASALSRLRIVFERDGASTTSAKRSTTHFNDDKLAHLASAGATPSGGKYAPPATQLVSAEKPTDKEIVHDIVHRIQSMLKTHRSDMHVTMQHMNYGSITMHLRFYGAKKHVHAVFASENDTLLQLIQFNEHTIKQVFENAGLKCHQIVRRI